MSATVTTKAVWDILSKNVFAVLSWVTPSGRARSAGIVYIVRNDKLLIGTDTSSWKALHIRKNPSVSITATFSRRIPLLPWIPIPDATITFHGRARVVEPSDVDSSLAADLTKGMVVDNDFLAKTCVIEVSPEGEFLTYGMGVSLMAMRDATKAQGRAAIF